MEKIITAEDQRENVQVTINIRNVELLVVLWAESAFAGNVGAETRKQITDALPALCADFQLPLVETFREFVEAYDRKNYYSLCKARPNKCLEFFAKSGDWRNVRLCIKYNNRRVNMSEGLKGAAYRGDWNMVHFFLANRALAYGKGLVGAAAGGQLEMVQFFSEKGARNYGKALIAAVANDQKEIARYLVDNYDVNMHHLIGSISFYGDWDLYIAFHRLGFIEDEALEETFAYHSFRKYEGAFNAATRGDKEAFDREAANLNPKVHYWGLFKAAIKGGNIEIVKLIGKDPFEGLIHALGIGQIEVGNYFLQIILSRINNLGPYEKDTMKKVILAAVSKGFTKTVKMLTQAFPFTEWDEALLKAVKKGHGDLVLFCIERGAKNLNEALYVAHEADENWLVYFLLNKGADDWVYLLCFAINFGDESLFNYCLREKGVTDWDYCLYFMAVKNRRGWFQYFLEKGANINQGLFGATKARNWELVHYFINEGANDWDEAFGVAVRTSAPGFNYFFYEKKKEGSIEDPSDEEMT